MAELVGCDGCEAIIRKFKANTVTVRSHMDNFKRAMGTPSSVNYFCDDCRERHIRLEKRRLEEYNQRENALLQLEREKNKIDITYWDGSKETIYR